MMTASVCHPLVNSCVCSLSHLRHARLSATAAANLIPRAEKRCMGKGLQDAPSAINLYLPEPSNLFKVSRNVEVLVGWGCESDTTSTASLLDDCTKCGEPTHSWISGQAECPPSMLCFRFQCSARPLVAAGDPSLLALSEARAARGRPK